jgi:uncharacterized protein (DUF1684 family)
MTAEHQPFALDRTQHEAAVSEWRRARLSRLTAPEGWLSLVGRFPLRQGKSSAGAADGCDVALPPERAPGSVGSFELDGTHVRFTPAAGAMLSLRGGTGMDAKPLVPGVAVTLRTDRDGPSDKLVLDAITLEVTERESGLFVRVRDPNGPMRRGFAGIEHYPVGPKWRVIARLERYEPPKVIDLDYEAGSVQKYLSPGAAVFEIDGVSYRVDPVFDGNRPRLYLVFWDQTARDTTYGAGRFLYAPLPEGDRVLLDFNLAFSPPCAFTPYAVCPIAPPQNRLAMRIEAGEKSPH